MRHRHHHVPTANSAVPWWTDEDLFKQPPPTEECPICMLQLPVNIAETRYKSCCGKLVCIGCICAANTADNRRLCPFCRTPEATSDREEIERLKKRVAEANDAMATFQLGGYYRDGEMGFPQSYNKANKLFLRAGKLGCAEAYNNIAGSYHIGRVVERDAEKAKYYYELAAMGGSVWARHTLGLWEDDSGNHGEL